MCGRYATTMDPETLYGVFEAEPEGTDKPPTSAPPGSGEYGGDVPRPRFNIAPTDTVPLVRVRPAGDDRPATRLVTPARWGLVPSWAKDVKVGSRMFNARSDSVATKPAFRGAFQRRRALLPASGYYEWRVIGKDSRGKPIKQPYYMTPQDSSVLAFAGLWEYWRPEEGDPVISGTIITTDAVGALRAIHDRMPLILPASEWEVWLDPSIAGSELTALLTPPRAELVAALELRPVSAAVGNVRNDNPELIERVSVAPQFELDAAADPVD